MAWDLWHNAFAVIEFRRETTVLREFSESFRMRPGRGNIVATLSYQGGAVRTRTRNGLRSFCHGDERRLDVHGGRAVGSTINTPGAVNDAVVTVSSANVQFVDPSRTTLTTAQSVYLCPPNSVFGPRFQQVDVSVNESFRIEGWARLRGAFDVYNVLLNGSSVESASSTYGNRFLYPATFLDARFARLTGTLEFHSVTTSRTTPHRATVCAST
jgi:hypothetical protein